MISFTSCNIGVSDKQNICFLNTYMWAGVEYGLIQHEAVDTKMRSRLRYLIC